MPRCKHKMYCVYFLKVGGSQRIINQTAEGQSVVQFTVEAGFCHWDRENDMVIQNIGHFLKTMTW